MAKLIFSVLLLIICNSGNAQHVQLQYSGSNAIIIKAIAEANRILSNPEFYDRINAIAKFDNTSFSGMQISSEMNAIKNVVVTEFFKKHTLTTAKTQTRISLNTAKLNRTLRSIVNTLIHETVHAVDWLTNKHWDYTHRTQHVENPPISAPYIIGAIGGSFVN